MRETLFVAFFVVGVALTWIIVNWAVDRLTNDATTSARMDGGLPARESWQPKHWHMVRVALHQAADDLARLSPPVLDTLHVGASDEEPGNCRITLRVFVDQNLTDDQKSTVVDNARPIIERHLLAQYYDLKDRAEFEYGVMYANADRNMLVVGEALDTIKSELASLTPSVISAYRLGPFSGEPDDFCIYLCVDADLGPDSMEMVDLRQTARKLLETELLKRKYAPADLATFSYKLVPKRELEDAGGWASYLR